MSRLDEGGKNLILLCWFSGIAWFPFLVERQYPGPALPTPTLRSAANTSLLLPL